jgi:fucose 4-O-acetylase-like acetyltransferase
MVSIQSNRISWVDWVKALSIFFVVVGHVGPRLFLPFVYAFHVPAFFVISGYLYKKSWWLQTFLSFTIPVFFFIMVFDDRSLVGV